MEIIIKIEIDDAFKNLSDLHDELSDCETHDISPYACFFDECSAAWSPNPEMNKMFLLQQQNYANERLKARGYLFLNEVFDMLGIPRTKAGQCIGWIYDINNPICDNYVDFGIYKHINRKFVNGYEKSLLLDFNVDGCILDRI